MTEYHRLRYTAPCPSCGGDADWIAKAPVLQTPQLVTYTILCQTCDYTDPLQHMLDSFARGIAVAA